MDSPHFLIYIAVSLDGYIATPDGGVAWLDEFSRENYGYEDFAATIDTVVMGRTSFEQVLGFGEWPYAGKQTVVLTSRQALETDIADLRCMGGDIRQVTDEILARAKGNIWIMGGAETIRRFLDIGIVHRMELFVMPVLLGEGVSLFKNRVYPVTLTLSECRSYPKGVVRLTYSLV